MPAVPPGWWVSLAARLTYRNIIAQVFFAVKYLDKISRPCYDIRMNQYLTTNEAIQYLGVSRQRLYQMIAGTDIRPVARATRGKSRPALWLREDMDRLDAIRRANVERMLDKLNGNQAA